MAHQTIISNNRENEVADALKHHFNAATVEGIARDIRSVYAAFDAKGFVAECVGSLDELELTQRARHVCVVMRRYLPKDYRKAITILVRSLGPEIGESELTGMVVFRYLPHVMFTAAYGLDHFEPSMQAQYELTKRFTAEFSIRAFLENEPERTLARLEEWTRDPSPHVRRLVSEGTRPRLPWAPRLPQFQRDPAPVIRLLERLKDDGEEYVRRSVANNLNDIGKDHPDLAVEVCRRWAKGSNENRRRLIRHALRSLVKAGHPGALAVLGFDGAPQIRTTRVRMPKTAQSGDTVQFSCDIVSDADAPQDLLVDFAVHFVKANGATSPKVFKLTKLSLEPGGRASVAGRVSLREMTTRRHYPGRHAIELRVNGTVFPLGAFRLDL